MKAKLCIARIVTGAILLSVPYSIFASVPVTHLTKSVSSISNSNRAIQEEPTITNEAEYAEYRKKIDGLNRTSSSKSATSSRAFSSKKNARALDK